MVGDQDNREIH